MKENKYLYKGEFKGMNGIILESRGGAKNSIAQKNPNYKLLLQYALETLKNHSAKNVEIYVASKRETKYPNVSDRLLSIDGKSNIDFTKVVLNDFITKLSKEIKISGQSGSEKGGNSTKRLFFHFAQTATDILPKDIVLKNKQKSDSKLKEQIFNALEKFQFDFLRSKKMKSGEIKILVNELQNRLKNYLEKEFTKYEWKVEHKADLIRKDSFDIYGYNEADNMHVVIELDPHRADSIAKKFVSRMALMVDKNLLYVAYLYPGTDKMPKNEADKYLLNCETIVKVLNSNSNAKKEFLGYYLKK